MCINNNTIITHSFIEQYDLLLPMQGVNIPRGRMLSGIYTPRVVTNTLFNEKECAIVVFYCIE